MSIETQEVIAGRTRLLWVLIFAGAAFLITWLTGLAGVLSTQATPVNCAHVVAHPLALPLPASLARLFFSAYWPALAALIVPATASGRVGVGALLCQARRR